MKKQNALRKLFAGDYAHRIQVAEQLFSKYSADEIKLALKYMLYSIYPYNYPQRDYKKVMAQNFTKERVSEILDSLNEVIIRYTITSLGHREKHTRQFFFDLAHSEKYSGTLEEMKVICAFFNLFHVASSFSKLGTYIADVKYLLNGDYPRVDANTERMHAKCTIDCISELLTTLETFTTKKQNDEIIVIESVGAMA